jgi:hypothetical protein
VDSALLEGQVIRILVGVLTAVMELLRWFDAPAAASQRPKPLTPVDAIAAIADALRTHPVVALSPGEGHGDARGPAFVISLIRDPRITAAPTDLVVEGANGRYQPAMDRYVRGERVADAELRPIWDDTTQPQIPGPVWTGEVAPLYRAVREVNATLPRERQMRVLLGDPPIEWERVHSTADFGRWLDQRDSFPADVIRAEVIAKGRRALVFFGSGHLQRRQQLTNYAMDAAVAQTVISLAERAGIKTFVVIHGTEKEGLAGWPVPSLAILKGTALGAAPEPSLGGTAPLGGQRVAVRNGTFVPIPREQWISIPFEEQTDALVYLGPASARSEMPLPRGMCADAKYVQVRLERMTIAGLPPHEAQRLRQLCGR